LGAALLVALLVVPAAARKRPSVEAFGNLPLVDDIQIAPDGRHIAVLRRNMGRRIVVISDVKLKGKARKKAFDFKDGSIEHISWANSDRLLITIEQQARAFIGQSEHDFTRIVSVSATGGKTKTLFKRPSRYGRANFVQVNTWVVSQLPDDPQHVLIPFGDSDRDFNLYKVDVESGRTKLFAGGRRSTHSWMVDRTGERLLRMDLHERSEKADVLVRLPGEDWKKIATTKLGADTEFEPLAFSVRPNILYVAANKDGYGALYEYDLQSNQLGKLVYAPPGASIDGIGMDKHTGKLLAVTYVADQPEIHHFDKQRAALQAKLDRSFPDTPVNRIISSTDDRKVRIIETSGPNQPSRYFYFDTEKNHAIEVAQAYPDLFEVPMGPLRKLTYRARDGLTIPAYLTMPPGAQGKNMPLVVLPHGGPAARDSMTFDYWAQFLASRGYAVLQPQFRGSTGFGKPFADAGEREWGGKMQDDVTDGVKYVIEQGVADPDRICILGGSYGGYAALMGAVKTPDLYKCAISFAGVSDLLLMLRDERKELSIHYWERHIGDAGKDREKLIATSPARQAEKIRIPILLIHGKDDLIVPYKHSESMADALKDAGKPFKLVPLEGEDHYLTFGKTRIAMLRETEKFLAQYLGAGPVR